MKMKKMTALLITMIMLIMLCSLVGCGNDAFDNDQDGKETVDNKITLTVGILNESGEYATMRKFKSEFEKVNSKINIRIVPLPGTYEQAISTFIRKPEDWPDIVWSGGDKHASFSEAGHFVNLKPYYEKSEETKISNYYEAMMEATHYSDTDEGIWYAPRDYNKPVTMINKKLFAAAGVEIPKQEDWNYSKFLEVCEQLRTAMDTNTDNSKKILGLIPSSYPVDGDFTWSANYLSFINGLGGNLTSNGKVNVDSAENINAYTEIRKLFSNKYSTNPQTDTKDYFLTKGAAMWFTVRPRLTGIVNAGIDVDFLPLPTEWIASGNSGYAISSEAKKRVSKNIPGNTQNNEELAWEFIKWIITTPGQEVFGSIGTGVPILKSLADNGQWTKYINETLNHKAFTAYVDRDITVNILNQYKTNDRYNIYSNLNSIPIQIGKDSLWNSDGTYKPTFTTQLNKIKDAILLLDK